MNFNLDLSATFTFALLTFSLPTGQGQGQICSLHGRPHPQGLCGRRLVRAHRNLCEFVRHRFPSYFPTGKRSHPVSPSLMQSQWDRQTDSPMFEFTRQNLPQHIVMSSLNLSKDLLTPAQVSDLEHWILSLAMPHNSHPLPQRPSTLVDVLTNHSHRHKRSLVCECCFAPCNTTIIARYC